MCICFQHFVIMLPNVAANATWPQSGKDGFFAKDETHHSILEGNKAMELESFCSALQEFVLYSTRSNSCRISKILLEWPAVCRLQVQWVNACEGRSMLFVLLILFHWLRNTPNFQTPFGLSGNASARYTLNIFEWISIMTMIHDVILCLDYRFI